MGKRMLRMAAWLAVAGGGIVFCLPVLMLLSGSLMDELEWKERLLPILLQNGEYVSFSFLPGYPSLEHFRRLLFYSPEFMRLFWNSLLMVGGILAGQLFVAVPGAWALSAYRFRGRRVCLSLYVILMLLPFQAVQLSRYLVLDAAGLMNTRAAVILPAIFSAFPVFLIYRGFAGIPAELLEAARIDGAGELRLFCRIGLPLGQGGILSAMTLGFLESFNMMEEPLAFLTDKALWPLSLYLPEITMEQAGFACCACVITLTVSLFVFALFYDSLEQGIVATGMKC